MMMKKTISIALTLILCLATLAGCAGTPDAGGELSTGADGESQAVENTGQTYEFSMGTPQPETSPLGQGGRYFCDLVYDRTDGQVVINYFPSSAIGAEKDCLIAVSGNELEFELAGVTTIDMFAPEFGFLNAPYLLEDMDHLMNLMDGEIGDMFRAKLLESNVDMLGVARVGVRQLTSNREIHSIDDLAGLKLRLPEIPTWNTIWSALGAAPVAIATAERYNALQTGVAEASEGTWDQVIDYNLHEVQKYAITTNHVCEFGGVYASRELMDSLPEDIQAVIREAAVEAMAYASNLADQAVEDSLAQMAEVGLVPVDIDTTPFNEIAMASCEEYFDSVWTVATVDEIMSYAN